ncbi:STAS domain-containing protein [Actinokineospora guangxiensis]|uniref:Anti-sigma factor antagonist n=1 Tax=Actinokineospora guangxiensis TaxID=1490288 RepID=A0ABW0EG36_9PSEU
MGVDVSVVRSETGVCATVSGELDTATVADAESALRPAVSGPGPVELDLSGVTFCGSAGLSLLLELRKAAVAAGVEFVIAGSSRAVDRLLDITGTAGVFTRR